MKGMRMKTLAELLDESQIVGDIYHNAKTNVLVYVLKTKNGLKPYEYKGVSAVVYSDLLVATVLVQSAGDVFNAFKKDYERIASQN